MKKGKPVVVDPGELDELRPNTTRTIDITNFVELSEVDPAYYQGPTGSRRTERAPRGLAASWLRRWRTVVGPGSAWW